MFFNRTCCLFTVAASLLIPCAFASAAFEPLTPAKLFPATLAIGDLVRSSSNPAVYYLGADGKRYVFPNDKTYFTWYPDFQTVRTISSSDLASIPLGANVTYRPGSRMVKVQSIGTVYVTEPNGTLRAVPDEATAKALYGTNWNQQIDDVGDAFWGDYTAAAPLMSASDYNPSAVAAASSTINNDKDLEVSSVAETTTVSTTDGSFTVNVIQLASDQFSMITDSANSADCDSGCLAESLEQYATADGADYGMHGTYFCPPDYADCTSKVNTFLPPLYNTPHQLWINQDALPIHEGPLMTYHDGVWNYYHRTNQLGNTPVDAAIANYPSLVENGQVVVWNESRLDDGMKTLKSSRGGIGFNSHYAYLVVANNATVPNLANVMQSIGATFAMNLDGGGSAALYANGSYLVGPGRALPNAILFKKK